MRVGRSISAAIATHEGNATIHQDAPALIATHAYIYLHYPVVEATLADYQANPGTGDSSVPAYINDGNVLSSIIFGAVDEKVEVDYGKLVRIKRQRHYGSNSQNTNQNGRYKIQYWNPLTLEWVDWVTGIIPSDVDGWTDYSVETEVVTTKIRWYCTTFAVSNRTIFELEVIF